jgi:hypothetical protein
MAAASMAEMEHIWLQHMEHPRPHWMRSAKRSRRRRNSASQAAACCSYIQKILRIVPSRRFQSPVVS